MTRCIDQGPHQGSDEDSVPGLKANISHPDLNGGMPDREARVKVRVVDDTGAGKCRYQ